MNVNNDFRSARHWAHALIEETLEIGDIAVDATMGNGHDTEWLCRLVGETGRVYAFDIQPAAVAQTEARLQGAQLRNRAILHCAGHERMNELLPESANAIVFNLGWLPGAPHGVTTRVETTLQAANAALQCLKPRGILTICIYPGHEEGARERDALLHWGAHLRPEAFDVFVKQYLNQPHDPPLLLAVRKLMEKTSTGLP
ncbi:MAG: methyltransferase domain-containing protein [Clostridia bacterium]|nr:methyltransferase domain-containing protein [Clostridia bacterium]